MSKFGLWVLDAAQNSMLCFGTMGENWGTCTKNITEMNVCSVSASVNTRSADKLILSSLKIYILIHLYVRSNKCCKPLAFVPQWYRFNVNLTNGKKEVHSTPALLPSLLDCLTDITFFFPQCQHNFNMT